MVLMMRDPLAVLVLRACAAVLHCYRWLASWSTNVTPLKLNLPKLPRHISLVLAEDDPAWRDVAQIVAWCAMQDIPLISAYRSTGIATSCEELRCTCLT